MPRVYYGVTIRALRVKDRSLVMDAVVVSLDDFRCLKNAKTNEAEVLKTIRVTGSCKGAIRVKHCSIPAETEVLAFNNTAQVYDRFASHVYDIDANGKKINIAHTDPNNQFTIAVPPPAFGKEGLLKLYRVKPKKTHSRGCNRYSLKGLPAGEDFSC